jgi:hypothetical protein
LHTVNTKQTCLNTVDIALQELTCLVLPEAHERMTQEFANALIFGGNDVLMRLLELENDEVTLVLLLVEVWSLNPAWMLE